MSPCTSMADGGTIPALGRYGIGRFWCNVYCTLMLAVTVLWGTTVKAEVLFTGDTDPASPLDVGPDDDLWIGTSSVGRLFVSNGSTFTLLNATLGADDPGVTAPATALIHGAGSHWNVRHNLQMRFDSHLQVIDGGRVTAGRTLEQYGRTSSLLVSGEGSVLSFNANPDEFVIESISLGSHITITDGGRMEGNLGIDYIGPPTTSGGDDPTFIITKGGSFEHLGVAHPNSASFNLGANTEISEGGTFRTRWGIYQYGGTIRITDPGSELHATERFGVFIGNLEGSGRIEVLNGGLLNTRSLLISVAQNPNSQNYGEVLVSDPGTRLLAREIAVGKDRTQASIIIENGAIAEGDRFGIKAYAPPHLYSLDVENQAIVRGEGTRLDYDHMKIGINGQSYLEISDHAVATTDVLEIGPGPNHVTFNPPIIGGIGRRSHVVIASGAEFNVGSISFNGDNPQEFGTQTHDSAIRVLEGGRVNVANDLVMGYDRPGLTFGLGATTDALIVVGGSFLPNETSILRFSLDPGAEFEVGDVFTLLDYGDWNGNLLHADAQGTIIADESLLAVEHLTLLIDYDRDLGGGDLALVAQVIAIPEPATISLLALAVLPLLRRRPNDRMRRRS